MGNNQGNKKGTAQDKREQANQVQKGSKGTTNTQPPQPVPGDKGGTHPGARRGGASERA